MHKQKAGEGEEEEKIWTCAEPFKTLLMNWTSCSMLSIGSLGRKYCSLDVLRIITEGTVTSLRETRNTAFSRLNLHTSDCHYQSALLEGDKLKFGKEQTVTKRIQ